MDDKRLGEYIRELRHKRGLSQRQLANVAQIAIRTLAYWESGERVPRCAELDCTLKALDACAVEKAHAANLVSPPRGIRLVRRDTQSDSLLVAPGVGDLLHALRLRAGWTQARFASELGVNRSTVLRWETTTMFPSDGSIEQICDQLGVYPEERAALRARSLQPPSWPTEMTLDECAERVTQLQYQAESLEMSVVDLYALTLERHLRMHAVESKVALRVLTQLHADHARWLVLQDRYAESAQACRQALSLMADESDNQKHWVTALNIAAIHVNCGQAGARPGFKLLSTWLQRLSQPELRAIVICDMALYSSQCGRFDQAERLLAQARDLSECGGKLVSNEELESYYRTTRMRVLTNVGRPVEALSCLPTLPPQRSHRMFVHMTIAETLAAAGDKVTAHYHLDSAQRLLNEAAAPRYQQKWDSIARSIHD